MVDVLTSPVRAMARGPKPHKIEVTPLDSSRKEEDEHENT